MKLGTIGLPPYDVLLVRGVSKIGGKVRHRPDGTPLPMIAGAKLG